MCNPWGGGKFTPPKNHPPRTQPTSERSLATAEYPHLQCTIGARVKAGCTCPHRSTCTPPWWVCWVTVLPCCLAWSIILHCNTEQSPSVCLGSCTRSCSGNAGSFACACWRSKISRRRLDKMTCFQGGIGVSVQHTRGKGNRGSSPHVQGKRADRRGAWANPHVRREKTS